MIKSRENRVVLFGSFDYFHRGHKYLIEEAKKHGDKIIVIVAQDNVIEKIKGEKPSHGLNKRIEILSNNFPYIAIREGDKENNSWSTIRKYKPNTIVVGYDQNELRNALLEIKDKYNFKIITIDAHKPEKYKSSILKKINKS